MKFTCDRCSKRFSSVDEPMPGRVYRIRCRCGNVIQITAPHVTGTERATGLGLDGARPAPPAIPGSARTAAARRATPAGDATEPVRHAAAEARTPLPTSGASAGPPPASRLAGCETEPFHPLATPIEALAPGPMPPRSASPALAPAAPPETHGFPSVGARGLERETAGVAWGVEDPGTAPAPSLDGLPSDAPFLAASFSELGGDFETTAPGIATRPAPRERDGRVDVGVDAAPPAVGGAPAAPPHATPSLPEFPREEARSAADLPAPVAPEEPAAVVGATAVRAVGDAGETSVELSVSEQYALPRSPAVARRRRIVVLASIAVVAGIGAAAAYVLTRGEAPPVTAALAVATTSAVPAAPAAAHAPSPGAAVRDAEERREAAARQDEARGAEAERAAAERQAAAERKAEADRLAAAERAARAEKQVAAAPRSPARPDPAVASEAPPAEARMSPPPAPGVDPALAETQHRLEDAPTPEPDPLPEGLEPSQLQTVIRSNRAALEECAAGALADPATAVYAGSEVTFIILVGPNGRAEAALEDPALDDSPLGACLRRAASRMTFPAFRGDPVGARIPLRIGAAP